MEMLAELPLTRDQVVCLSHEPGPPAATDIISTRTVKVSSVTGPRWSIPLSLDPCRPGSLFCPESALGHHLMGLDEEQVGQSKNAQWRSPAEMTSA